MTYTDNLNLKKPADNDYVDIQDLNDNMDTIDGALGIAGGIATLTEDGKVPESQLPDYADGATFTPAVSADGDLSWTNDGGLDNPTTVNIKGEAGQDGLTTSITMNDTTYEVDDNGNIDLGTVGGGDTMPAGAIIMYTGSTAPDGWAICDGTNGTPNLRDKFIVGAGTSYDVGATGGANTVTLTSSTMPSHTHSITKSLTASSAGAHTHSYAQYAPDSRTSVEHGFDIDSIDEDATTETTESAGAHTHSVTGTITAASTGSGGAHENRPPYYALMFIMKLAG